MLTVVTVAVTYILTPYTIDILGMDGHGVWLLITSLTAYLVLVQGGLPAASVRYLAEAVASEDQERINRTLSSTLRLYLWLSLVAFAIGAGLYLVLDLGYDVPSKWTAQARPAYWLCMGAVSLGFVSHLPYALMEARDDFVLRNLIGLASLLLKLGLTLVLLWLEASIAVLGAVMVAVLAFELTAAFGIAKRRYPGTRFSLGQHTGELTAKLLTYSAYVLVLAVGGRLAFQTDALVIGAYLDVSYVSVYSTANSLTLYLMDFVAGIAIVVMPKAAKLREVGDEERLRHVFLQWSKASLSLSLLIGGFLLFMGPAFLGWWINEDYQVLGGHALQVLVVSFLVFLPVRGAALPVLMGVTNVKRAALVWLAMGVVNVGISIALVQPLGLVGAALGTAIPNVVCGGVLLMMCLREIDVGLGEYLRYVFGKAVVGVAPVFAMLAWFSVGLGAEGFWGLLYTGVSTVVVFTVIWVAVVYRGGPYLARGEKLGR